MIPFLTPKYIKQAKLYIKGAEKRIAYHRDLWSEETLAKFKGCIVRLRGAIKSKDKAEIKLIEEEVDNLCSAHCPQPKEVWMSENVEVFLVAIVIALGIRTYFLQPFTIPTASMFPTLNGITGKMTNEPSPNALIQAVDFATKGRSYCDVVAKDDETIVAAEEVKWMKFFVYTKLQTDKGNTYWIGTNPAAAQSVFFREGIIGRRYKKGDAIARGYTDTGDHVFVDKMSYHFRRPTRGEVFVFTTQNIEKIRSRAGVTQYYIKRLAGLPGDKMQIEAPNLYVNGKTATEPGLARVMTGSFPNPESYQGYSNTVSPGLDDPDEVLTVPDKGYYALGDNSYASSDSRDWGHVPEENLVGVGVFVYWPFLREKETHFGLIR